MVNNNRTNIVHPIPEKTNKIAGDDDDDNASFFSSASHSDVKEQLTTPNMDSKKVVASIKFCIIMLISVIVLMSVLLLSAIWMGSLLPSNFSLSNMERDSEFNEIVESVKKILRDVTIGTDVMRGQIRFLLDFEDLNQIERVTFQSFMAEHRANPNLVVTLYVGKNSGTNMGIYNSGTDITVLNCTEDHQIFYNCDPELDKHDTCQRKSVPDVIEDPLDVSYILETCNAHPNKLTFTPGFVDVTTPNLDTFYSLVYCFAFNNRTAEDPIQFDYFLGFDVTVASASEFLIQKTKSIKGSKSFIFEVTDRYLVAIDNTEAKVATQDEQGNVIRKTTSNIDDVRINDIYQHILEYAKGDIKSNIKCNTPQTFEQSSNYISIYRLCLDTNIDWMFVLSIPTWNYLGSVVIGILASLVGALLISAVSIVLSVVVSIKIVKPFHNLIEQFEAVSHMDLENIKVQPTRFSEVNSLQKHFLEMTNTIKLYRAFLPAHLLTQLDQKATNNNQGSITGKKETHREIHSVSGSFLGSHHEKSSKITSGTNNSSKSSKYSTIKADLFSLFLEKKKVTICNILIDHFSELLSAIHSPNDAIHLLTDFFDQITTICRTQGGLLGNFENDSITVSFNTTFPQSKDQERAVFATKMILDKLNTIKQKKWLVLSHKISRKTDKHLLEGLEIRSAICNQECVCGNVGTNESKNYTLISNAKYNLEQMLRVARELDLNLVVSHSVQHAIEQLYHTRYIDQVKMIHDREYSTMKLVNEAQENELNTTPGSSYVEDFKLDMMYEVGDLTQGNEDEWMYELHEQEKKQKWKIYNKACQIYFEKDYANAIDSFQLYYDQQTLAGINDKPAIRMIQLCLEKRKEQELM